MKMNQPIGNALYGPLLIRVSLGIYFLVAGFLKLDNFSGFIEEVVRLNVLPKNVAVLYATLLPYLEIGAGGLMILGFWTTLAACLASLMLASFIVAFKLFPQNSYLPNKDVILLCAAVSLMYTGAGAFSVDRFRSGAG